MLKTAPMKSAKKYLILDYETRSELSLKDFGSYEYARHPTTEIICLAWRFGTRENIGKAQTHVWSPLDKTRSSVFDTPSYGQLVHHLTNPEVVLVAHNALFEQLITRYPLGERLQRNHRGVMGIPINRWVCTASLAAALALPRSLEGASNALGFKVTKDMDGRRLLLKMTKPRRATKNNNEKWHETPEDVARLTEYCRRDVDVETELFLRLPPLTTFERKVWELDQAINLRGLNIDRELVQNVLDMIEVETEVLNKETHYLTNGVIKTTNQRAAVLKWLEANKSFLPDLKAKTVADALSGKLMPGKSRRILEIRQAVSKTSTSKYESMERSSRTDGRIRDILMYHGASTGRFTGLRVQPHNFPRGTIKDTNQAAEILRQGDLELVRMLYDDPMRVFSSCLRSAIIPSEGCEFFCADYNAIEARVLFWFAKHEKGLQAFRDNRKLYEELAASIYSRPVEEIGPDSIERWVGKTATLGLGFGMGDKKFRQTGIDQAGVDIGVELSKLAVSVYREEHRPVVELWHTIQKTAIAAVREPGKKFTNNYTTWWAAGDFLYCKLPSGRNLAYYKPDVKYELPSWGGEIRRPVLYHWGVNPKTRQWERAGTYYGPLVENIVQATARDLMVAAMLRLEDAGYTTVLTVHDELLNERKHGEGSIEKFKKLMAECPPWAVGLPVKVTGWQGVRYRKG